MQYIYCADNNNLDANDKAAKIRPLMDKLKQSFLEHFVPEEEINYDESMVKYLERHSCKQFIRGKPIRFGFKMWCLNSKDGYLTKFIKEKTPNQMKSKRFCTANQRLN